MERKDLDDKMEELFEETLKMFREKYERLISRSGAIDLEEWDDNYILPRLIMNALCKEAEWQWRPLSLEDIQTEKRYKKEIRNMEYFM